MQEERRLIGDLLVVDEGSTGDWGDLLAVLVCFRNATDSAYAMYIRYTL